MKGLVDTISKTKKPASQERNSELIESLKIMVVGAGGAGCNAINRLAAMGVAGAQLVAVNTDRKHLTEVVTDDVTKLLIGKAVTRGLGAGGYPEMGAKAAEVSRSLLEETLADVDLLFLTAGMGGGTGSGAAPIVAEIAKDQGAIVIAMVTYPFALEKARLIKAEEAIEALRQATDTVVVIDNNRLVELVPNLPIDEAFRVADEVIARTVRGITETITQPSLIGVDFADVRSVMSNKGLSVIAVGESKGVDKVNEVVEDTLRNALLDVDIGGAKSVLIHITGGPDLTLGEANKIGELLTENIDPKAMVIWGARIDPTFENRLEVISIFTGVKSPYIKAGHDDVEDKRSSFMSRKSKEQHDLDLDFL